MMFDRYRAHLETELVKQELTLKFVIAEKEKTIQRLDEELKHLRAKCERYELMLLPRLNPALPKPKPREVEPESETNWHNYRKRWMEEEEKREQEELAKKGKENGIHIEGRPNVHEQGPSNAGRPDDGQQQASGSKGNAAV